MSEVGRINAPYLLGNVKAVMEKSAQVDMTLAGGRWQQNPFPYQAKCLRWLRETYRALDETDRVRLDVVLSDTGVLALFD